MVRSIPMENDAWECWDWETVVSDIEEFGWPVRMRGLTEAEVLQELGEPDDVIAPGLVETAPDGTVVFIAEKDLRYYGVMPHTCANVSIAAGKVGRAGFWAKWKRCPVSARDELGRQYAPE